MIGWPPSCGRHHCDDRGPAPSRQLSPSPSPSPSLLRRLHACTRLPRPSSWFHSSRFASSCSKPVCPVLPPVFVGLVGLLGLSGSVGPFVGPPSCCCSLLPLLDHPSSRTAPPQPERREGSCPQSVRQTDGQGTHGGNPFPETPESLVRCLLSGQEHAYLACQLLPPQPLPPSASPQIGPGPHLARRTGLSRTPGLADAPRPCMQPPYHAPFTHSSPENLVVSSPALSLSHQRAGWLASSSSKTQERRPSGHPQ